MKLSPLDVLKIAIITANHYRSVSVKRLITVATYNTPIYISPTNEK
jgi:hypothetical protein